MSRCPTCHRVTRMQRVAKIQPPWNGWLPRHDEVIRERLTFGDHPAEIAAILSARFPIPRSEQSVRRRIQRLSLSTRDGWRSRYDAIRMLGISGKRLKRFEADGSIAGNEFGRWRRYRIDDLERLVREHAGRFIDPRRVRDQRLRSLAEVAAQVNARAT